MPRVSVITGFYNRGPLLERTIESILNQTFNDFELVVFDDQSTDDSAMRLAELAARYQDARFRYVIHERNKGFVRGLREAIAGTTGEYIAIQGSGDASLPIRLERQAELLDARPEVGVVGGWYFNVQEDQGTRRLRKPDADSATFESLLQRNIFSHGEVMMRRSVHDSVGGYRTAFKFAQDIDLWLRVAKVSRFATVPEPVYDRYVQFDGVSYVPQKTVTQLCYAFAARRLALLSEGEEAAACARIEAEGPAAIVSADDPVVQRHLTLAATRMILFGSPSAGVELAHEHIVSTLWRNVLVTFGSVVGSPLSAPLTPLVRRIAGIRGDG